MISLEKLGLVLALYQNKTYFLDMQWQVDMFKAKSVVLEKLVRHDWSGRNTRRDTNRRLQGQISEPISTELSGLISILPFSKRLFRKMETAPDAN